jgi:hypothetical protein
LDPRILLSIVLALLVAPWFVRSWRRRTRVDPAETSVDQEPVGIT